MKRGSAIRVAFVFLVLGSIAFSYKLRVQLAIQDPDYGLALEVLDEEPSVFALWRIRIFLLAGADPDRPIGYWDRAEQPLVVAVQRGNVAQIALLSEASSDATWSEAVAAACAVGAAAPAKDALATSRGVDAASVCAPPSQLALPPW